MKKEEVFMSHYRRYVPKAIKNREGGALCFHCPVFLTIWEGS